MQCNLGCFGVGVVLFSLAPPTSSFSRGASRASCWETIPRHIRAQPRDPQRSQVTLRTTTSSYLPGQLVTVTVRSSRDFMGFLLQARRVVGVSGGAGAGGGDGAGATSPGPVLVGGSWTLTPPGTHTLRCLSEGDTITHSDKQLKRNLSFVWKAPDAPVGDIRFYMTVVQSYFVYWAGIESTVVHDGSRRPWTGSNMTGMDAGDSLLITALPDPRAHRASNQHTKEPSSSATTPEAPTTASRGTKSFKSQETPIEVTRPVLEMVSSATLASLGVERNIPVTLRSIQNATKGRESVTDAASGFLSGVTEEAGVDTGSAHTEDPKRTSLFSVNHLPMRAASSSAEPGGMNATATLPNSAITTITAPPSTNHSFHNTNPPRSKSQNSSRPVEEEAGSQNPPPHPPQTSSPKTFLQIHPSPFSSHPLTSTLAEGKDLQSQAKLDTMSPVSDAKLSPSSSVSTLHSSSSSPTHILPATPVQPETLPALPALPSPSPISTPPHFPSDQPFSSSPTPSSLTSFTRPSSDSSHLQSSSVPSATSSSSPSTSTIRSTFSSPSSSPPTSPPPTSLCISTSTSTSSSMSLGSTSSSLVSDSPHPEPSPAPRRSLDNPPTSTSSPGPSGKLPAGQRLLIQNHIASSDPQHKLNQPTQRTVVHLNPEPHPNLDRNSKLNVDQELKPNLPNTDAKPKRPSNPPGAPDRKGKFPDIVPRHSAWELGMLLGSSAGLGMMLVVGLRYVYRQTCGRRTEVTLTDREREPGRGERGLIHVQECGDLVRVRRIRENSFVLLAEYDVLTTPGD